MTSTASTWDRLPPTRGALARMNVDDAQAWADRLRFDRERAARHQSEALAAIARTVESRGRKLGADALVLSGSTARGQRTRISDLDYHVIGRRPDVADLPEEIDLYADDPARFGTKLRAGDDFAHWSVWYGCILFDSGVLRAAAAYVAARNAWPDPARKLHQARGALDFAERMVESADSAAALEQVRNVLSLTARWLLLAHDRFPLARDELSDQILELGGFDLAAALHRCIHSEPCLDELAAGVRLGRHLTSLPARQARAARLPAPAV